MIHFYGLSSVTQVFALFTLEITRNVWGERTRERKEVPAQCQGQEHLDYESFKVKARRVLKHFFINFTAAFDVDKYYYGTFIARGIEAKQY